MFSGRLFETLNDVDKIGLSANVGIGELKQINRRIIMAKAISKKRTRKAVSLPTVEISRDGENFKFTPKTTCTTFGKILLTENGDIMGKCKRCAKANGDLAEACSFVKNPEGFEVKEKAKRGGSKRPFDCGIELWLMGEDKEGMVAHLVALRGMKETAAKRFANDIFSVSKAAIGQARKKGGLIDRYMDWAIRGIGEEPTGCKATLGFCKPYAEAFKEMTL